MKLPWIVTRPMVLSTVCVVTFIAVLDFFLRVFVGRGDADRPYEPPAIVPVPAVYDAQAASGRLESWFPKATAKEAEVRERVLTLRGVFRVGGAARATLFIEPIGSLPGKYVLVSRGDEVEGWRVITIEPRKISLTKDDQVRELEMFKTKQGAKEP